MRSKRYLLTINNPTQTTQEIQEILTENNIDYACGSYEIGENGTPHYHIYIERENRMRFDQVKKWYPTAHIDYPLGTAQENRDYVFKIGKHEGTEKATTNDPNSHWEIGTMIVSDQGKRNDITKAIQMIEDGYSNLDIIRAIPSMFTHPQYLNSYRQNYLIKTVGQNERENLSVMYIYGPTGVGKTTWVYKTYGYENVYRINSDDKNAFDNYQEEPVLLIDEFNSSIKFQELLQILDKFPHQVGARYTNKWLCATTIIILSNKSIMEMYPNVQKENPELFPALLRRFNGGIWLKTDFVTMTQIDVKYK
jgi:hypothetical protein